MHDPLYTPVEVAELLRVMPQTILVWCRQGRLRSIKLGTAPNSQVRIPASALRHFRKEPDSEDHA